MLPIKPKYPNVLLACAFALTFALLATGCSAKAPSTGDAKLSIVRDEYGVPHIFAEDNYGVYFGYGYAVAQDRLFQMEMLKRTVEGRVAEVYGKEYLDFDRFIRGSYDSRAVPSQVAALAEKDREILQAYADGMNRHLAAIRKSPETLMPKEFLVHNFQPENWTANNVAMLFAGSIAHRYSDFNTELDNLNFFHALQKMHGNKKAWRIFTATKWLFDSNSPTTVPDLKTSPVNEAQQNPSPAYLPQLASANKGLPRIAYAPNDSKAPVATSSSAPIVAQQFARTGTTGTPGFGSASNFWAVNGDKAEGAKGIFLNGPQFGWSTPSYVYSVGLHGGDFDLVGNTLLALPAMLFAHNNHIGWGSTAGFGDQVDIFEERLNPKNPEQYLHRGIYRDFESWLETIKVKGEDSVELKARRSVHGMVQSFEPSAGIAYTKARAWEGKEVDSLLAWVDLSKQKNIENLQPTLNRVATNINFYVIDKMGNLLYRHGGHYPLRSSQHDTRLPVPGNGDFDWQGIRPGSDSPTVYNPKQQYLMNWNNRPARGWQSPDLWWVTWYRSDRADVLVKELESKAAFTPEQLWDINTRSSYADIYRSYFLPFLKQAVDSHLSMSEIDANAWEVLSNWDGSWVDRNQDGKFDSAGSVIFESWLSQLLKDVILDDVGEKYFSRFAPTGEPTSATVAGVNLQPGTKALIRNLDGLKNNSSLSYDFFNGKNPDEILLVSFHKTVAALAESQGKDVSAWSSKPHPLNFVTKNFRGIPQTLDSVQYSLPVIQNRGSENNLFVAKGTHIEAWDSVASGQSGFISPAGKPSKHHRDQLSQYQAFGKKKLAFSRDALNAFSEELLNIRRGTGE